MPPVVSQDDLVALAICPACKGSALFVIEKFVSDDDRADMARLRECGYRIMSLALRKATGLDDCQCTPEKVKPEPKAEVLSTKPVTPPSGKPVLSLRKKN